MGSKGSRQTQPVATLGQVQLNELASRILNCYVQRIAADKVFAAGSYDDKAKCTTHGMRANDRIRIVDGNFIHREFEVVEVIDADTFRINHNLGGNSFTALEKFDHMRPVTPRGSEDGSQLVTVSPDATQFKLNGTNTYINKNTATPANSRPMPTELLHSDGTVLDLKTLLQTLDEGDVVDFIDTTPLLNAAVSTIPKSSSNSLSVVAASAAASKKIMVMSTIGSFIGIYSGPVATPTLEAIIPPGGENVIPCKIPIGTLISIRNMEDADITSGLLAINLIG